MMKSEYTRREFLLLQLPSAIAAAQLTLMARTSGAGNFLVINILVWFCSLLLWIDQIQISSRLAWGRWAPLTLPLLLWVMVVLSRPHTLYDPLLNAIPLATLTSLALLLPGSPWRALCLLGCLPALHYALIGLLPTEILARITASLTAQMLWFGGRQVLADGDLLLLPDHILQVGPGCTGVNALSLCVASVVALLLLNGPLSLKRSAVLLFSAPVISMLVNAFRVGVLALMPVVQSASGVAESSAFRFWHNGNGSTLFSLLSVSLLFALEHFLRYLQIRWP
jgi:exosortase/archaeosortase family protein